MENTNLDFIREMYETEKMAVETYGKVLKRIKGHSLQTRRLKEILRNHEMNLEFWKSQIQSQLIPPNGQDGIWRSINMHLLKENTHIDFHSVLGGLLSGEKMSRSRYFFALDHDFLEPEVKQHIQKLELPVMTQNIQILKSLATSHVAFQMAN